MGIAKERNNASRKTERRMDTCERGHWFGSGRSPRRRARMGRVGWWVVLACLWSMALAAAAPVAAQDEFYDDDGNNEEYKGEDTFEEVKEKALNFDASNRGMPVPPKNRNVDGVFQMKRLRGGNELEEMSPSSGDFGLTAATPEYPMLDAIVSSFAMILVSELGDETFIIAAIMAMRHPRAIVLAGALGALYLMTVFSSMLGYIVPNLISKETTHNLATLLYTFFGVRLMYIAYTAEEEEAKEEIDEVEQKLESGPKRTGIRAVFARFCTPMFLEAFVLTFTAEWGDRSQIATIALASHKNPYGVTIGAIVGHTICTTLAVLGGRLVATQISQRTVAVCGGLTFFAFAVYNVLYGD